MAGDESQKPTQSWAEELRRLDERIKEKQPDIDVERTRLVPGWEKDDKWQKLRDERDRLQIIKTALGWLSADAAARVDRRLRAAGEIIDAAIDGRTSEAALRLCQAEHAIQRAWWSRRWNSWPSPWKAPMWAIISITIGLALGATAWAVFDQQLFPRGEKIDLPDALFGAALWGFAGGLVNGLRTLHHRVQGQQFERERVAWYMLSPVVGFAFGAIAFLLFLVGLLSAGQDLEGSTAQTTQQIDPTPIFLLAVLAGLAQNAFFGGLQQIVKARFRGAVEEEETAA